jgi:hypothetical protein
MDDHARRVLTPLTQAWTAFENDAANLLDRSWLAEQASGALDNASAPLPQLLRTAASDLEFAYYANEQEDHLQIGRQILEPVLAELAD